MSNERDALSPEVGGLGSSRFEFRFAGPDSMQNAVQRHNDQRAAELAEQSRRRDDSGKSLGGGPIFCKVRSSGRDVISKYTSRDMDVETQLSVAAPKCRHFQQRIPSEVCDELDSLESLESVPAWVQASGAMLMVVQPPLQQQQAQRVRVSEGKPKLQIPPCVQRWALKVPPKPRKRAAKTQPKRRIIPEELRQANSDAGDAGDAGDGSEKRAIIQKAIEVLYREPTACFADVIPSPMMSQAIRVKVCEAPNISYFAAGQFMQQHRSLEPESTAPFFREDSDLEHEYKHREEYMCEVGSRPSCGSSQADATLANCHNRPMFCEVECGSRGVHLWRSLNPLRYTSQRSEETPASSSQHRVVPLPHKKSPAERETDELQTLHSRQPGGRDGKSSQAATATDTATATVPCQRPKRRRCRQMQLPVCSQSLEHLKCQKLGIYNKISLKQERIIGALDRLQHSLLQLQVPECSSQERRKRERNAFEFCVRFSRNFLYPLKGMIDDVRRTPVTHFHSVTSNEACQRVVSVYGLMHQSIATYQRQLRYFLLDKVPQKLSALMEMIYTLSSTCVEKGILDRQDPVAECLRERCTRFLTFIEDMQEERFKLAREQYRRVHRQPQPPQSVGKERKSKQNYDLKMCLNDHKMYEPRLVAKKKPQELKRGRVARTKAPAGVARATESAADNAQSPEEVRTQVAMDDVPEAKLTEQQPAAGRDSRSAKLEDELQQALIDALRHVSRSEVQQVLDPLMRSIGAILDEKMPKH
ncbi:uncharacterized protein LOC117895677 [Drosophila subobscura]|uniref:uncharacterized protein LOC117895677 n=1 Tax=Drosophila subobscura TaxID=7241 RepID=UPI00155B21A7|nr:uncharacterized protein LOC117895677 [Drosophila subobscura]